MFTCIFYAYVVGDLDEDNARYNDNVVVVVMIETPVGVANGATAVLVICHPPPDLSCARGAGIVPGSQSTENILVFHAYAKMPRVA